MSTNSQDRESIQEQISVEEPLVSPRPRIVNVHDVDFQESILTKKQSEEEHSHPHLWDDAAIMVSEKWCPIKEQPISRQQVDLQKIPNPDPSQGLNLMINHEEIKGLIEWQGETEASKKKKTENFLKHRKIQMIRKKKLPEIIEEKFIEDQCSEESKDMCMKEIQKKYLVLQNQLRKVKKSFRKQEKAIEDFLYFQMMSSAPNKEISELQKEEIINQYPEAKTAKKKKWKSKAEFISHIKDAMNTKKENQRDKQFYDIPEIEIQEFPKIPLSQKEAKQLGRKLFKKFENQRIDDLQVRINTPKMIKIIGTKNQQQYLINWNQQNRLFYIGESSQEKQNGVGFICKQNQYKFKGEFVCGKRNGKGKETTINGRQFFGDWLNDQENGYGQQIDERYCIYEGSWQNGKKQGFGKMKNLKGEKYQGSFSNGMRNGYGIWKNNSGEYFKGNFLNDRKHGYGEYYEQNILIYKGEFRNGFKVTQSLNKTNFINKFMVCEKNQDLEDEKEDNPRSPPVLNYLTKEKGKALKSYDKINSKAVSFEKQEKKLTEFDRKFSVKQHFKFRNTFNPVFKKMDKLYRKVEIPPISQKVRQNILKNKTISTRNL